MKTNFRLAIILIVTVTPLLLFANARGVTCTYESEDVPIDIPDQQTISSSLTIPDSVTIQDVDVVVNITHTWDTDLDVYLIAPDGTQVELFTDVGGNGNDFIETHFDDEASIYIGTPPPDDPPPFTDSYKPEGMLSDLDGKNALGTWQLKIKDDANFDSGVLLSWRLIIDIGPAPAEPSNPNPQNAEVEVAVDACLSWDADPDSADTTWDVYMPDPNGVLQLVASDLTEPSFCPGELSKETVYSWQVVAKKACQETPGPIWMFRSTVHPKIIFVASVKDNDEDGVQDDQSWVDWLKAEGYNVDARPDNWVDPLDDNKIAELEAADLIIAGRGMSTGSYDGAETDKWNSLSTPILCTNAWMIRSSRWKWMNSGSANKDAGSPLMLVLDPTHPIFDGVPVDSDGLVDVLDPNVASGNTSFLNDILDVGNGTLLAQSLGVYNTMWIAEWDAGVEYYEGAEQIAGGKRILFMAGTQDDPYTVESGLTAPVGVFNLNEAGQQLLRNIIAYMLPAMPVDPGTANLVHSYTFEDGTANDSVGEAHGFLVGGAEVVDGAMVTTAQDQWMEMPGDMIAMNTYPEVTIEAWYTPEAGANTGWSMLGYFGDSVNDLGSNGYFMTSARGDDKSRAAISIGDEATPWASESGADGPEYDDGLLHHMVSTLNATDITLYIDGVLIASTPLDPNNMISGISQNFAYLAKGGYEGDPEWIGAIHEFNIYNKALSAGEVRYLASITEPIMLDVENFSFELPGTGKQKCWDGENLNSETGDDPNDYFTDVPGWSNDSAAADSGVEGPDAWPGNTEGVWAGYMMGTDPSTYNLLNYDIKAGDNYVLSVDARDNWTSDAALPAQLQMTLYYEADGVRVPVATQTVELITEWATFVLPFSANDVPESIGSMLGIEINNASNATADNNSWIGMDNVRVSVSPN